MCHHSILCEDHVRRPVGDRANPKLIANNCCCPATVRALCRSQRGRSRASSSGGRSPVVAAAWRGRRDSRRDARPLVLDPGAVMDQDDVERCVLHEFSVCWLTVCSRSRVRVDLCTGRPDRACLSTHNIYICTCAFMPSSAPQMASEIHSCRLPKAPPPSAVRKTRTRRPCSRARHRATRSVACRVRVRVGIRVRLRVRLRVRVRDDSPRKSRAARAEQRAPSPPTSSPWRTRREGPRRRPGTPGELMAA